MKNTKRARRAAAFAAAVVMAACAAVPMGSSFSASAAGNNSITIDGFNTTENNDNSTHTYEAYQVFAGQYAGGALGNITWGSGVDGKAIVDDLANATGDLAAFKGLDSPKAIAEELAKASDDDAVAKAFAALVGKHLKDNAKSGTYADGKITDLEDGYYLVQDASNSPSDVTGANNNGAKTRFILKVAGGGNVTVTAKSSAPSVIKKVKEDDKAVTGAVKVGSYTADAQYNDVADYCIGENVPFELISTMPSTYNDYTSYFYQFTDTLASNFTLNADSIAVKVVNADGETALTATTDYTVGAQDESGKFTITINDTKKIASITKDSTIVVDYTAQLNSGAVIGLDGQENKVDLTYSNNPNYTGDGASTPNEDKGKTPEDKVIVFTYELDVTKYLGDEHTKANAEDGTKAGFKLGNANGTKWATVDENLRITDWVDDVAAATEVTTDATGIFKFIGLDDGTYTLRETTTPTGYNTMADLALTIGATTDNNQTWAGTASDALSAIKLTINNEDTAGDTNTGIVATKITNQKGSSLPSTGGIGTTMFYVGGGVLVAGAGVLLITKKRAKKDAE
ncbi:MAG: isopeptide-forming domain-containing fimbrial protein [Ruminococcus sp.]